MWVFANALSGSSREQRDLLVDWGVTQIIVDELNKNPEPRVLQVCLEAIENILENQASEDGNKKEQPISVLLEEMGALDILESLQGHSSQDVYTMVSRILGDYFEAEDDSDDDS
mmetsp:Transcript_12623/g.13867  ORF Transcript_12623/g.13867 Transcript_12623/m.13867 type:complete len:114 (-) Transcript_12623:60-401(-)